MTMQSSLMPLVSKQIFFYSGCATVEPWAAVAIGVFAGWFYLLGSNVLIRLRIDDAVDAIPVHMVCLEHNLSLQNFFHILYLVSRKMLLLCC